MANIFDASAVGLPMMLFSILGVIVAIPVLVYAVAKGRRDLLRKMGIASGLWFGVYAILFLLAGFTSQERTVPLGERLAFCGFYIDCHLGVRVDSVLIAPVVYTSSQLHRARGEYYVAWLRFDSDARALPLMLHDPQIVAIGAGALRIPCDTDIGRQLMRDAGLAPEYSRRIQPRGDGYAVACVFDVPRDQVPPRLRVRKGGAMERLTERVLIGDTDSAFHAPIFLALTP